MVTDAPQHWTLETPPKGFTGFAYGSRYPSLVFTLAGQALPPDIRTEIGANLTRIIPGLGDVDAAGGGDASWQGTLAWLLAILDAYQRAAGLPVFEAARVLVAQEPRAECQVSSCGRSLGMLSAMLQCTLALIPALSARRRAEPLEAELARLYAQLRASNFRSSNVPRFIRAAFDLGIPFRELPGQFLQYGEGRNACWLDSTFTDATPYIGTQLAKDKLLSGALLRQTGLPVPEHHRAATVEDAVRVAGQIGYPVVVKPANLDGGAGVAAGLRDAREVTAAFDNARKLSNQILVEQHVHGADYRLTVLHDEVIWAVERVPGGVTGDGHATIAELIAEVNADPRRGEGAHSPLKRLVVDAEAKALLVQEGLAPNSVPDAGRFIRLRRAANVASGGMPVAVFERVHPDNARLAVRAARALQLDLAGVDLLIPDISRSWRETGAAICEVNAQPQLGGTTSAHVYPQVLKSLVKGNGRMVTAIVMSNTPDSTLVRDLGAALGARGAIVGVHDETGVRVNDEVLVEGAVSLHAAGTMLSLDRRVEAMILSANTSEVLASALPVQRIDALVLAQKHDDMASPADERATSQAYDQALRVILPACDGDVICEGEPAVGEIAESLLRKIGRA